MKFYFCETCGKRLTEKALDAGLARDKKLRGVYCTNCAESVLTMDTLPMSNDEARSLLKESGTKPAIPAARAESGTHRARRDSARGSSRRSSAGQLAAARGSSSRSVAGRASGVSARSPERQVPQDSKNGPLFAALGGVAAVLIAVVAFFALSGSSEPKKTRKKKANKPTEKVAKAEPPVAAKPVTEEKPTEAIQPPPVAPDVAAKPTPPQPAPQPAAAPQPEPKPEAKPEPEPPPVTGEWKNILEPSSLKEWVKKKSGRLVFKDGYYHRVGGSIEITRQVPGKSIMAKLKIFLGSRANVDVKTACGIVIMNGGRRGVPRDNWFDLEVKVDGGVMTAKLNDKPVRVTKYGSGDPRFIYIYFKKGGAAARVKDVQLLHLK